MYELSSKLVQTGKIFSTQINNNYGSFEINNVNLKSSYVEFSASGYYFDEIKGDLSIAPLTMNALSDIADVTTVNVNVLTHLEKARIEYLIKSMSFSEAKKTAQAEILAIFGFSNVNIDKSETLDISADNDANAILLAISAILQGNRSVGDLTELLANITNDIKEDGLLDDKNIISDLRNSALGLSMVSIRYKLQARYQELGINAIIPAFENYLNGFLSLTGLKPASFAKQATNITPISATLNGIVNANDLPTVVTFEYGTSTSYGNTVTASPENVSGHTNTSISANISGLITGTQYHFRVKAVNSQGTSYSANMPLSKFDPVTDIDGNVYKTVSIGTQQWMAENLRVTKYRDGTIIPYINDPGEWILSTSGAYCAIYPNDTTKVKTFGRLYNYYAVTDNRKLCPAGWHVPSDAEWTTLTDFLINNGYGFQGSGTDIAKSLAATSGWTTYWTAGTPGNDQINNNSSGFTALPGGVRNIVGAFSSIGMVGLWWSLTPDKDTGGWFRGINFNYTDVGRSYNPKTIGFSVRCLRD
jgi:uncharacterized protein (TIGR02145 family)